MPKKPHNEDTKIGQLETQIENLRETIGFLFCLVVLLTVYVILQLIQQSIYFFIPYGLTITFILLLLLFCVGWSFFDSRQKESGAPAGT